MFSATAKCAFSIVEIELRATSRILRAWSLNEFHHINFRIIRKISVDLTHNTTLVNFENYRQAL